MFPAFRDLRNPPLIAASLVNRTLILPTFRIHRFPP
jgi:hypothetical protein